MGSEGWPGSACTAIAGIEALDLARRTLWRFNLISDQCHRRCYFSANEFSGSLQSHLKV